MHKLPNFLYIGTRKAGSTWLFDVLNRHPDVYMAPNKGLHFFSNHYGRGLEWYAHHFAEAGSERIRGEVSHSYLAAEKACERIATLDPETKLMACLREPAERAFSEHLHARKNGTVHCEFEAHLERDPGLVGRGLYARHLAPYLERFGPERLHVAFFDDLVEAPEAFARDLFGFLEVDALELSAGQRRRMMPAGESRSELLTRMAKSASHTLRLLNLSRLRAALKTSRRVRSLVYRPYASEGRPAMRAETRECLRRFYQHDVARLDELLGTRIQKRWGYA